MRLCIYESGSSEKIYSLIDLPDDINGIMPEWIEQTCAEEEIEYQERKKLLQGDELTKLEKNHKFCLFCIQNAKETLRHNQEALEAFARGEYDTLEEFNRHMDELENKNK